ncbi:hypothetical protein FRC08_010282 [Ceratobasidium sp. 394]|nr:hypothetical protein FRC08_010282 [Ceratobasidium sp. 394]
MKSPLKVYQYLTNHSTRGTTGCKEKAPTVKHRIYAHDLWANDNKAVVNEAVREHLAEKPEFVFNVGTRRSFVINLFRQIPKDEQEKYRQKAGDELKTIRSLQMLDGDARMTYIERFTSQLEEMLQEGDKCAGIKANVQVLHEDEGGFHITTIVTESMAELEDAPEIDKIVDRMKLWVKDRAGKSVVPNPEDEGTIYPDSARNGYPLVPVIVGLKVVQLQKMVRLAFKFLWLWQGGSGPFPWELLRHAALVVWLEYFRDCQSGIIPPENHIQFSKVFAGPNPIDRHLSQESSRRLEHIPSQSRETWVLEFADTVTRCHAPGGVDYPTQHIKYAKYIQRCEARAAAAAAVASAPILPREFIELPTGDRSPTSVIDGQEKVLILKWAEELPDAHRALVVELVDAINAHQSHLPASTPCGVWVGTYANSMPAAFPSSPDALIEGLQFFMKFWLPLGYYTPGARAELIARLPYLRLYFEDILVSPLVRHVPSNTLVGDHNGSVWLVRVLILFIFNFAAANGDLTPPSNPPAGSDLSCLPYDELAHVLSWSRLLIELLRSSTSKLAETSDARRSFVPKPAQDPVAGPIIDRLQSLSIPSAPSASSAPSILPAPSASSAPSGVALPATTNAPRPSSGAVTKATAGKRRTSRAPKKKRSDRWPDVDGEPELSSGESGESDAEQDFEKLDRGQYTWILNT